MHIFAGRGFFRQQRRSADYQAEGVARRISVDAPGNRLAARSSPRGYVLAEEDPARGEYPLVCASKVTDQNVEVHDGAS